MSRSVPTAAAFCFLALAGTGWAEELPPLVVPEELAAPAAGTAPGPATAEPAPEGVPTAGEAATEGAAPDAATADVALPEDVVAPAAATTTPPDLQPPAVDARVDLALPSADFDSLGFPGHANGYRFIVSFRLENAGGDRWSVAPEVGYFRMGQTERQVVTVTPNVPPGYDQVRTDTFKLDVSSLDFGVRLGHQLQAERLEAFARGGLAVTHARVANETLDHFEPKPGTTTTLPDTRLNTTAVTNVTVDPYVALGLALKLGKVPSVYAEYGLRTVDGHGASTFALGLLLDF